MTIKNRYIVLVTGFLSLMFLGLIYAWSIFLKPLETVFNKESSEMSHIFTLSLITFCIGGFVGGILIRKFSSSVILRISATALITGFVLSSTVSELWQMYISYGVFCGFGVGLTYNAVLSTVVKWFPDRTSFCSGVLLMGFGSGALFLGSLAQTIISSIGWNYAFLIIGLVGGAILIAASFIVINPKIESNTKSIKKPSVKADNDFTPQEMVKTSNFWMLFFWAMFVSACGVAIIGQGKPIATQVIAGLDLAKFSAEDIKRFSATAALAVGVFSIFNGLGRVITGAVYTKLPRKSLMTIICLAYCCAAFSIYAAIQLNTISICFVGFSFAGMAYGSVPAFGVSIIREYYGAKNYSVNMSLFTLHLVFASVLGSSVGSMFISSTKGYVLISLLVIILVALGAVLIPFVKNPKILK